MKAIKKSRFLMLHPDTNQVKINALNSLLTEYVAYVQICVSSMIEKHTFKLYLSQKQTFFPKSEKLSSQIEKNARDHAIQIVSGWAASAYKNKIQKEISKQKRLGEIDSVQAKALYTIGKYSKSNPDSYTSQEQIDSYWTILLEKVKVPMVKEKIGMRLSEMTSRLESPKDTSHSDFWLRVSSLEPYKSIWLPLVGSSYVKSVGDLGKGFLARKTKNGRWRFESLSTQEYLVPDQEENAPRIGIDVGLNVIAATSDGSLLGQDLKPKFDSLHKKVKSLRANRQRQGLKENSKRLDCLESKLSGLTKTAVGEASNRLVNKYPGYVFVIEDLDLSGCKGSKRFCYRALHHNLASKAHVLVVNPAYTSQECPSCGYVHRGNRSGVRFHCRACGRKSHADVIGAINLLRRSEDKQIGGEDNPFEVGRILRGRYFCKRRDSSLGFLDGVELKPISLKFTTKRSSIREDIGTVSNLIPDNP